MKVEAKSAKHVTNIASEATSKKIYPPVTFKYPLVQKLIETPAFLSFWFLLCKYSQNTLIQGVSQLSRVQSFPTKEFKVISV